MHSADNNKRWFNDFITPIDSISLENMSSWGFSFDNKRQPLTIATSYGVKHPVTKVQDLLY